ATAHHYGMVREQGIGPGTLIKLTRSGMVIPKIEKVLEPAEPQIPDVCPSCGSELVWESHYRYCPNSFHCPAQVENAIEHFFRVLGNIDGFGAKTIEKLYQHGIRSVYEIYMLDADRFQSMGFGEKTAHNLVTQLRRSRVERIEDWRFLGAFGIYRMGLGNCERLLQHHALTDIFELTVDDILKIEGFADLTARAVVKSLKEVKEDFFRLYDRGYNLETTPINGNIDAAKQASAIAGKLIVFSGAMKHGTREEMTKEAKKLGAMVGTSVTGKTDFLVAGENVGESKINSAKDKGVSVISEETYLEMLGVETGASQREDAMALK
ncbi:MAG: helix-hairpin-helix domain-containing protein, partial [Pseudomonadota bacterium]